MQAVRNIDLNVNADKTESMCFKQVESILTFSWKPLQLEDQFTYLIYRKWCENARKKHMEDYC